VSSSSLGRFENFLVLFINNRIPKKNKINERVELTYDQNENSHNVAVSTKSFHCGGRGGHGVSMFLIMALVMVVAVVVVAALTNVSQPNSS
jgi:hypothetical protein